MNPNLRLANFKANPEIGGPRGANPRIKPVRKNRNQSGKRRGKPCIRGMRF
jgi:hypothetical protein